MALTSQQIVDGINAADFTLDQWNSAMAALQIQAQIWQVQSEIAQAGTWLQDKSTDYNDYVNPRNQQIADLQAQLDALASGPE